MPDPAALLRHARREALFVLGLWFVTLVWTVGVSYRLGYHRPAADVRLILGMPDWTFYGVLLPWLFATVVTVAFSLFGMKDDDLGVERGEDANGQV